MVTIKRIFGQFLLVPIETPEYKFAKHLDDFSFGTFTPISGCTGIGQLSGESFDLIHKHAIALKKLFLRYVGINRLDLTVEQVEQHLALMEQENVW